MWLYKSEYIVWSSYDVKKYQRYKQSNGPREHLTGTGHNIQLAVAV